ncbi:MAG: GNAT family N-acetyltransferase [Alphaproteobacteria bacterium]|nr:GNAT family N-acetyltransferase [Alphaproteobacteria bacterium]
MAPHPAGFLEATITYLEMRAPPASLPELRPPAGVRLTLLRAEKPTLAFYRFLYDTVGEGYHWVDRKRMSDARLRTIIEDERVEIYVLYVGGVPAGYAELDRRTPPEIELAYFGLMPGYLGRGLGSYFLNWAVRRAWEFGPRRVWVHTNTMDHPHALPLYQRFGFVAYARRTVAVDPNPNPPRDPD